MKRHLSSFTFLLVIILLLVSCGTDRYECTDPLGCLEILPENPVVVGTILATLGQHRPEGVEALNSLTMAVDEKELLGHPVQLLRYGTDCTPDNALEAATEYATRTDIAAVIGPSCNNEAEVAGPVLLNAGIPMLAPAPDSSKASSLLNQAFSAIELVAVRMPDGTLYIPRQALLNALQFSP